MRPSVGVHGPQPSNCLAPAWPPTQAPGRRHSTWAQPRVLRACSCGRRRAAQVPRAASLLLPAGSACRDSRGRGEFRWGAGPGSRAEVMLLPRLLALLPLGGPSSSSSLCRHEAGGGAGGGFRFAPLGAGCLSVRTLLRWCPPHPACCPVFPLTSLCRVDVWGELLGLGLRSGDERSGVSSGVASDTVCACSDSWLAAAWFPCVAPRAPCSWTRLCQGLQAPLPPSPPSAPRAVRCFGLESAQPSLWASSPGCLQRGPPWPQTGAPP